MSLLGNHCVRLSNLIWRKEVAQLPTEQAPGAQGGAWLSEEVF